MGIPTFGRVYDRGGFGLVGDIRRLPPEHSGTDHCNQTHYGSVSGGKASPLVAGVPAVVGEVELVPGWYLGGIKGGIDCGDVGLVGCI